MTDTHKCYKAHCGDKKGGTDFYFKKWRIENFDALKNTFDYLKCAVCNNLVRQPKECSTCENNICSKCLVTNEGTKECPCCKEKKPIYIEINRVLKNLLVKA